LLWEAQTGREYASLKGHGGSVTAVSWRGDSNILASASEDGTVRLWELEEGRQVAGWNAHAGGVAGLEFARDGKIVSCGRDRLVKLWDQNGGGLRSFEALADLALETAFCNETNRVIAGDWSGLVRVFNAADGAIVGTLDANPPRVEERVAAEEAQVQSATSAVDSARQHHAEATAAHQSAIQTIALEEKLVSLLQEAMMKAQQAGVGTDPELTEAASQLNAMIQRCTGRLEAARQAAEKSAQTAEQAKTQQAEAEKTLSAAVARLNAIKQRARATKEEG
jgi:hypothetical protein